MRLHAIRHPWQLALAVAMLTGFVALDLPTPWATPVYYELAADIEPWFGADELQRAREDLSGVGLEPSALEIARTFGSPISCQATGCKVSKALRATFNWTQIPGATAHCFTYNPLRFSRDAAYTRTDCRPIHTWEDFQRRSP